MTAINEEVLGEEITDGGGSGISTPPIEVSPYTSVVKAPPVGSNLVVGVNGYGRVSVSKVVSNEIIVTLSTLIWDYVGDCNQVIIENNIEMNLGSGYRVMTDSEINNLNINLATKDMYYNRNTGLVTYKLGNRLPTGSMYFFVNDRMSIESAVDDGLNTGIHSGRFSKSNYITGDYRTTNGNTLAYDMSKALLNALSVKVISSGSY